MSFSDNSSTSSGSLEAISGQDLSKIMNNLRVINSSNTTYTINAPSTSNSSISISNVSTNLNTPSTNNIRTSRYTTNFSTGNNSRSPNRNNPPRTNRAGIITSNYSTNTGPTTGENFFDMFMDNAFNGNSPGTSRSRTSNLGTSRLGNNITVRSAGYTANINNPPRTNRAGTSTITSVFSTSNPAPPSSGNNEQTPDNILFEMFMEDTFNSDGTLRNSDVTNNLGTSRLASNIAARSAGYSATINNPPQTNNSNETTTNDIVFDMFINNNTLNTNSPAPSRSRNNIQTNPSASGSRYSETATTSSSETYSFTSNVPSYKAIIDLTNASPPSYEAVISQPDFIPVPLAKRPPSLPRTVVQDVNAPEPIYANTGIFANLNEPTNEEATSTIQSQVRPTVKPAKNFNPAMDAKLIARTLNQSSPDKDILINILCKRTQLQRLFIVEEFDKAYGKLKQLLNFKFFGEFKSLMISLLTPNRIQDVMDMYEALVCQNWNVVSDIMCIKNNEEIKKFKAVFERITNEKLETAISSKALCYNRTLMMTLCAANRVELAVLNYAQANSDALLLRKQNNQVERHFVRIFTTRSFEQIKLTSDKYYSIFFESLERKIKDVFNSTDKIPFLNMLRYATKKNSHEFYANLLYKSMKGLGTNNEQLIRIIVQRSEIDLMDIKETFEQIHQKSLKKWIKGDTSGSFRQGLYTLIGEGGETVPIFK